MHRHLIDHHPMVPAFGLPAPDRDDLSRVRAISVSLPASMAVVVRLDPQRHLRRNRRACNKLERQSQEQRGWLRLRH